MPSPPRRRAARKDQYPAGFDLTLAYHMAAVPVPGDVPNAAAVFFMTDDQRTRAWDVFCDEVLGWWPVRHPGTRPHLWWLHNAPKLRRGVVCETVTSGCGETFDIVEPEDEAAYLARLKLLTRGERETREVPT